jgi:hypothetical protein
VNESGRLRAGRKWAAIVSIVVVAALGGLVWWLMGGCETKSPSADGAKGTGGNLNLAVLQAMNDTNVLELSLQTAYFFARENRLPKSIAEVTEKVHVPDWPAAPSVTTRGLAIAYRATGERTYELVLPGDDKQPGTADDVAIPEQVPTDIPPNMDPLAFRSWWILSQISRLLDLLPESVKKGLPAMPK